VNRLVTILCLAATFAAAAGEKIAPIPAVIILCGTNASAPVTVVQTSSEGFRQDNVKQRSVVTNLTLTCMSVRAISIRSERESVRLVLSDGMMYGPAVVEGKYGRDQKLLRLHFDELAIVVLSNETIQINGDIYSAHSFAGKYRTIPEPKK
jgi:hypothetical protein